MKKLLSLSVSMLTLLSSVSVINANAGTEYNKPLVVKVSTENDSYSEILDDGKILSFYNHAVPDLENGSNMDITYYADEYAEEYSYSAWTFSMIFKLKENCSIDDFDFVYDNKEFEYSKLNDDNVYQIFNTTENSRGLFTYSYACGLEKALAENPDIEDTDIVWGYTHYVHGTAKPTTRIGFKKEEVSLTREDFSFLEDSGFSITDVSENCGDFEILYDGKRINNWKRKTEAMRMILQNIDGIYKIDTDFEHHALAIINGYSMLEGYSITGVYDYNPYIFVKGDANADGGIDIADALAIASYVGDPNVNQLNESSLLNADVNGDGFVDTIDILVIQQYLAGIITEL